MFDVSTSVPTTDTRPVEIDLDGDHDRFAHYAQKAAVNRAYVTGEEIVAQLGAWAEAGVGRIMLQWLDLDDLDGLEALAVAVLK